jgi:hypothetical protein
MANITSLINDSKNTLKNLKLYTAQVTEINKSLVNTEILSGASIVNDKFVEIMKNKIILKYFGIDADYGTISLYKNIRGLRDVRNI